MEYLNVIAALVFVLSLMALLVFVMKKLGLGGAMPANMGAKKRLKVIEALPLDAKHRLLLIQRDETQHLIIVGGNGEVVVERGIKAPQDNDDD